MHDIRAIRDTPADFDAAMARRGLKNVSEQVLAIDTARRASIAAAEAALADRNAASKQVGKAKASGDDAEFQRLRDLVAAKKTEISALESDAKSKDEELRTLLMSLPNIMLDTVPDGTDEDDNVEVNRQGTPPELGFAPKEHFEIQGVKPGMDFELGAKLSGARFVVLSGAVARIHRALAQFMLNTHIDINGLQETWTPVLVRDQAMFGTGQLPKFGADSFFGASLNSRQEIGEEVLNNFTTMNDIKEIQDVKSFVDKVNEIYERGPTHEDFWLVPTAEVTLTNLVNDLIVEEASLPRRYVAHTQCFRSEAGSAGRDTAGMLRQHQFEKVEMVSITKPEDSAAEHARMTACAEDILTRLGLAFRTVELCSGDTGFGAQRTYDIEVWLPGQNTYREISSVSVCGAFQARRMNARFRPTDGGKPEFVHTLNGSGLAVGRTLIAVLENGQTEDGGVNLPEVLHPYLGGATRLAPDGTLA